MARIRTIKPEFPQSETTGKLSRDARLLFIQMWTIADDAGRLRGASKMLASLLYPYDDDARGLIDGWLDELEREACINRFTVDGTQYISIVNWLKHQRIEKPSKSRFPSPPEYSGNIPGSLLEESATDLGPRRGKRKGKKKDISPADAGGLSSDNNAGENVIAFGKASEGEFPVQARPLAKTGAAVDSEFLEWYATYPRRIARGKAFLAYKTARKKTDKQTLLDGAKKAQTEFSDLKFTPHPATWLNGERWADEKPETGRKPDGRKLECWEEDPVMFPPAIYRGLL